MAKKNIFERCVAEIGTLNAKMLRDWIREYLQKGWRQIEINRGELIVR